MKLFSGWPAIWEEKASATACAPNAEMLVPSSFLLLAALVVVLALSACSSGEAVAPAPRRVPVQAVSLGNAGDDANYSGEVLPRIESALSFRVGGKLAARLVNVGDTVKAGQVLARLDAADVALSASAAQAQLAAAEADRNFARSEVERYRDLKAKGFVSQSALDGKEAAFRSAQGRWEAAQAQSGLAGNQRNYAVLSSDADGVVSAISAEVGQVVAAGQVVVKVARPGEKEVAIAVPENRLEEIRKAGDISIALWADPQHRYRGRIREVAAVADSATRTYAARVSISDADAQVRLGMTANVFLHQAAKGETALLPATAIFQQGNQPAVWVVGADNKVALRPVTVAAFREDGALVSAGVQRGERVVTAGVHKLVAGETVRPADEATVRSGR